MKTSIRRRISFSIGILLTAVMVIYGTLAYLGVKESELQTGKQKLESAALHLTALLNTSIQNITVRAGMNATNDTLVRFFREKKDGKELKDLLKHWTHEPQMAGVQLFDTGGKTLVALPDSIKLPVPRSITDHIDIKNVRIGNFYAYGPQVVYPVTTPVRYKNERLGYLVRWRKLVGNEETLQRITGLLGSNTAIFIGNTDGTIWSDLQTRVKPPMPRVPEPETIQEFTSPAGIASIGSLHSLESTGWLVCVQLPKAEVHKASARFLYWIVVWGLLILGAGILIARSISRQISNPVRELTSAASNIAAGTYENNLLQKNRPDEIGKLARAFSAMTHEIQNSHKELLSEAEKYKVLFHENPVPMWIMARDNYQILDVNLAAIDQYGYSREEFLRMTALDLRTEEEKAVFINAATQRAEKGITRSGIWRHKKKDGTLIQADVVATNLTYKNRAARLVVAHDVTEKLEAEARLLEYEVGQQKLVTETTIHAQEKEREEIGRELHDNINQILASVKLYLELGRTDDKFLPAALDNGLQNVKLAISEIRQLSKQLVPPRLTESLPQLIDDLLTELSALTQIEFSFNADRFNEQLLDDKIRLMIYRIVQEQVNNIVKHAGATQVQIRMETGNENLTLTISDNGKGFDPATKPKGIGLTNMDSRVKFYNGIFRIQSQPGAGSTVTVVIPLNQTRRYKHRNGALPQI